MPGKLVFMRIWGYRKMLAFPKIGKPPGLTTTHFLYVSQNILSIPILQIIPLLNIYQKQKQVLPYPNYLPFRYLKQKAYPVLLR